VCEDDAWNKNIAEGIAFAFRRAVENINSEESRPELRTLARTWPEYINCDMNNLSTYWLSIGENMRKHLQDAPVLRNQAGKLSIPNRLKFLDWAGDRNGNPMLDEASNYVSADYSESIRENLVWLGVTPPSWEWMCQSLKALHDKGLLRTRMKNGEWCSDLARMILQAKSVCSKDKSCYRSLSEIPLIPLSNGTWRCSPSQDDPIYFPVSSGTPLPLGLSLALVDKQACVCPQRKKLFQLLGVETCMVTDVVRKVFALHAKVRSETILENMDTMISQLMYLYKVRERVDSLNMEKLQLVCCTHDHFRYGRSMYADVSATGELEQLFTGYKNFHRMDDAYFAKMDPIDKADFARWLSESAGVALAPRIVTRSDELHVDFRWMLENRGDHVLEVLRQNWGSYSTLEKSMVEDSLVDNEFMCRSGWRTVLSKTYLPFPKLLNRVREFGDPDRLPFLELPSGKPEDWKFLHTLGVLRVKEDLHFYLWILHYLTESIDIQKIKQLYQKIQLSASPKDYNFIR
jgi:hypothetical protein